MQGDTNSLLRVRTCRLSSPGAKATHTSPGGRTRAVAAQPVVIPPPPPPARPQAQWPQGSHPEAASESMHASPGSSAPSPSAQAARKDSHKQSATAAIPVPLRRRSQTVQPRPEPKPSMVRPLPTIMLDSCDMVHQLPVFLSPLTFTSALLPLFLRRLDVQSFSLKFPHNCAATAAWIGQQRQQQQAGASWQRWQCSNGQPNGHAQPQAWPAAASQSAAGVPGFRSWRHQKKRRGPAPPDPEVGAMNPAPTVSSSHL